MGKAVNDSTQALCVHFSVVVNSVEGRSGGTLALLGSNPWGTILSGAVFLLGRCSVSSTYGN